MKSTKDIHLANQKLWDATAQRWADRGDQRGIWFRGVQAPELVFVPSVLRQFQSIDQKEVAVLGSGDNEAVFALAGLGAKVTSVDLSKKQLEVAAKRAKQLHLEITFVQADVVDLRVFKEEQFDLVFTGGHVGVWVADLMTYYQEALRILKPGGTFIVEEYHPFRRIWKQGVGQLQIAQPYLNPGPFKYVSEHDQAYPQEAGFESYEFHWTIGDYVNAIINGGGTILSMEEYGDKVDPWEDAPLEGIPELILIVSQKNNIDH